MTSSAPSADQRCRVLAPSMYTYPRPAASAAAHVPLNGSDVEPTPGVNADQVPPAWITRLPSGDQLNDSTEGVSNSWRGKPDSFTIHTPPEEPSASAVANATQWRSGRAMPVWKTKLWSRNSWLPWASRAAVPTSTE